eukprot:5249939-Amphidinium_carterae.2
MLHLLSQPHQCSPRIQLVCHLRQAPHSRKGKCFGLHFFSPGKTCEDITFAGDQAAIANTAQVRVPAPAIGSQ